VFVSDDDDHSDTWLGATPVEPFLDDVARFATDAPLRVSALAGELPSGCASELGTAQPAVRYVAASEATGGIASSICAADFSPLLEALGEASITYPTRFPLSAIPEVDSVVVSVNGLRIDEGWALEAPATVVFDAAPAASAAIRVSYVVDASTPGLGG
jgi:hypothetical protein